MQSSDPVAARMGACAWVLADAERATEEAVGLLTHPLGELAEARVVHTETLAVLVGRALERLPDGWAARAVESLVREHGNVRGMQMLSLTHSMLGLAFRSGLPPAKAADLTPLQRRALEAIRDHGPRHFANYDLMLDAWELPGSPDEVGAWLDGEPRRAPRASPTVGAPPRRRRRAGRRHAAGSAPADFDAPGWLEGHPSSILQRIMVAAFVVPIVVIVALLDRGHRSAAGWTVFGICVVGTIVILAIRHRNAQRAAKRRERDRG